MKARITKGSQLLLGLIFFVFCLNGFFHFIPTPPLPEGAMAYLGGLAGTGYFFPVLKGTEIVVGLLLLTGIAAPLALVILAPISIQIFLFHAILTPGLQNLGLPALIVVLHAISATAFWSLYRPLFTTRAARVGDLVSVNQPNRLQTPA